MSSSKPNLVNKNLLRVKKMSVLPHCVGTNFNIAIKQLNRSLMLSIRQKNSEKIKDLSVSPGVILSSNIEAAARDKQVWGIVFAAIDELHKQKLGCPINQKLKLDIVKGTHINQKDQGSTLYDAFGVSENGYLSVHALGEIQVLYHIVNEWLPEANHINADAKFLQQIKEDVLAIVKDDSKQNQGEISEIKLSQKITNAQQR